MYSQGEDKSITYDSKNDSWVSNIPLIFPNGTPFLCDVVKGSGDVLSVCNENADGMVQLISDYMKVSVSKGLMLDCEKGDIDVFASHLNLSNLSEGISLPFGFLRAKNDGLIFEMNTLDLSQIKNLILPPHNPLNQVSEGTKKDCDEEVSCSIIKANCANKGLTLECVHGDVSIVADTLDVSHLKNINMKGSLGFKLLDGTILSVDANGVGIWNNVTNKISYYLPKTSPTVGQVLVCKSLGINNIPVLGWQ
jgi:hypothetical protein